MKRGITSRLIAIAAVGALALVGCNGDDNGDDGTTPSPTEQMEESPTETPS